MFFCTSSPVPTARTLAGGGGEPSPTPLPPGWVQAICMSMTRAWGNDYTSVVLLPPNEPKRRREEKTRSHVIVVRPRSRDRGGGGLLCLYLCTTAWGQAELVVAVQYWWCNWRTASTTELIWEGIYIYRLIDKGTRDLSTSKFQLSRIISEKLYSQKFYDTSTPSTFCWLSFFRMHSFIVNGHPTNY